MVLHYNHLWSLLLFICWLLGCIRVTKSFIHDLDLFICWFYKLGFTYFGFISLVLQATGWQSVGERLISYPVRIHFLLLFTTQIDLFPSGAAMEHELKLNSTMAITTTTRCNSILNVFFTYYYDCSSFLVNLDEIFYAFVRFIIMNLAHAWSI